MHGGTNDFKYYIIYVLNYGNSILRKYIEDTKITLSYLHRLMSKFLRSLKLFLDYDNISQGLVYYM